jgi:hypothetical protein
MAGKIIPNVKLMLIIVIGLMVIYQIEEKKNKIANIVSSLVSIIKVKPIMVLKMDSIVI